MKWYGKNFYNNPKNYSLILHKKNIFQKKIKLYSVNFFRRLNLNKHKIIFSIPPLWDFIFIKNKINSDFIFLYFFSQNYFFYLPLRSKFLIFFYDKNLKIFTLNFYFINNFYKLFWNLFKIIFYSFTKIFFKKLKFKGKGYYIYKNYRNTIALRFGYSHVKRLYFFSSHVKFLSKTSVFIFGLNTFNIINLGFKLFNIRPINIFTGKGIRFTRQIIYRKTGKISSYR